MDNMLETLARAVAIVAVAGYQTPVTVEPLGRTFDTDRRVRVSRPWAPQDEHEADETHPPDVWEGTIEAWVHALRRAVLGITAHVTKSWVLSIINNGGDRDYRVDALKPGDWPNGMGGMFMEGVYDSEAEALTRGQAFMRGDL